MTVTIGDHLTLPSGLTLKNRLAKGAMTEGLGDPANQATQGHANLYRRWAHGGIGLSITGNILVDKNHLERPGNVAIDGPLSDNAMEALKAFAAAGTEKGTALFAQLNHAGRQTPALVNPHPLAPSDVKLGMPGGQFGEPRAMTESEIRDVIARFARTAKTCQQAGFTGVQIHAAHGYLLSEFLSPDVNTRADEWGGSLENRARLLLSVLRAVRSATGPGYPISVKLNSADFQRGGFSHEDSLQVARWLNDEGIDFLEISGGTYEQPRMAGADELSLHPDRSEKRRESTVAREAYFLDYAADIRKTVTMPLMVTGGFRTVEGMNAALASGDLDLIGIARPLCVMPEAPGQLVSGALASLPAYEKTLRLGPGVLGPHSRFTMLKAMNGWGQQGWFCLQLLRMGEGRDPDPKMGLFKALRTYQKNEQETAKRRALYQPT